MTASDASLHRANGALRPVDPEVLLIEDDQVFLAALLEGLGELGLKVAGASSSVEALMQLSDLEPTCILVDLKMPNVEGLDLVAALCASRRHEIIVLSAYVDVQTAVEAMRLGAWDVLQKPCTIEGIATAIKAALASLNARQLSDDPAFTRRERQVGELLVQGLTAKQIAQKLSLSPRTIEFFRANLMRKTHSPNSVALASALTRIGFS